MMRGPATLFRGIEEWDPAPLRRALIAGQFHIEGLESLGMPARWLHSQIRRAALLGRVPDGSVGEGLLRLFLLGDRIPGDQALRCLGEATPGLVELGFLGAGGGEVWSEFALLPAEHGWVAYDFLRRQGEDEPDFVMGVGPSSRLLATLTPPTGKRVLELASGIGWLAQSLAKDGKDVVATDLNPRALELGHFAAKLNGIRGVEFLQGDLFSAVEGERFDLIVANPPYVQSPGGTMTYREGPENDPVCARLLNQLGDFLAPGGIAIILINWSHEHDEDWSDGPLSWVPSAGMRRWLFQSDCSSPIDYAWLWISGDERFKDQDRSLGEVRRWLKYYRDSGIERLSGGFIILQKCEPGEEWTRLEQRAVENITAGAGSEVLRIIENESWIARTENLLECFYSVPDGVRADAAMRLGEPGWERETIRLTSAARLGYDGQIDENILRLLAIIREGRPPMDMVRELRAKPEFANLPELEEKITELIRELVVSGVLSPLRGEDC